MSRPHTCDLKLPVCVSSLTVIKLAVGLLAADDVKAVRDVALHAADLKVEPLEVLGAVHVRVQDQVILVPENKRATERRKRRRRREGE